MNILFPENFCWGAATSGPQSEGRFHKKHANMFDYWYDKEPEKFYNYVGPNEASNFYNDFVEDIQLMKRVGLKAVRTSIQWSRLIDDFEKATVVPEAVEYYNSVIDEFIRQGIRPMINLCHFDLPIELYHKYGGWENKKVSDLFAKYAKVCFELFGDRVKDWFTFNEPMVIVDGGYLYQFHFPNKVDGPLAVQVAYNLVLSSAKAIKVFKEVNKNPNAKIGIILNLTPPYPATNHPEDLLASRRANLWKNRLFMDSAVNGIFPEELVELLNSENVIWQTNQEELALIANNTVDYLGINFYHPDRVQRPEFSTNSLAVDWMPDKFWRSYDMPGRRMNHDKGWEIFPKALYDIGMDIKNNYGNIEWFVSENGMGVSNEDRYKNNEGIIEDDYRIIFIKEHLYWLHKAIQEGSNCFGYHLWTPIDCWSWTNAYRNRYGLISTDITNQEKTVKKSGQWFSQLSEKNSFELDIPIADEDLIKERNNY